jgi:uncharacterized protein YcfJ
MKKIFFISIFIFFTSILSADVIRINVDNSTEIYKRSLVQIPHTQYIEEQVQIPYDCGNTDRNSIGLDTIIGSIAGVVIGNQIGAGNGRTAAKIIGGIGGGYTANQLRKGDTCYRMEFRKKPITKYTTESEDRLVGYKNCGSLGNRQICKKSREKLRYFYLNY